jgi:CRISPR-associated protein (TIGR02710 family)
MMGMPHLAKLTTELKDLQQRWLTLGRKEQDELCARQFVAPFARLFAELPLHGAPENMPRPRALISVLGLSWQPVVLMAAWCKPQRMLAIGTAESLSLKVDGEGVLDFVARIAGIPRDTIEFVRIGDPGEIEIYRAIGKFLRDAGIPPREIFVDPTGGKKSMSASAALAGFLAGTPLVYVDYGEYHGPNRIPVAGTEYPRLLANPLEILGDLELRDVFSAFNRSDFQEARRLAERLAERLYEPREAECLARLARGYDAWDRFNFPYARRVLEEAKELIDRFGTQGRWGWTSMVRDCLKRNLVALEQLTSIQKTEKPRTLAEAVPLLLYYLAAARRLLTEKPSLAVLLTYAAVERYTTLCLWVDYGLDPDEPDPARIRAILDESRYHEVGREMFGSSYKARGLEGPLMFASGAQLLITLEPERLSVEDWKVLHMLSVARNKCEYEHGRIPEIPSPRDAESYWSKAKEIIARALDSPTSIDDRLRDFELPRLISTTPGW